MMRKVILIMLFASSVFAAHQIEANVNSRDVEGSIRLDMGRMGNAMNNAYIGARFLKGDNNNSKTIADPDPLMEVSFLVMRPVQGVPGLKVGLGMKGEYTKFDGNTYSAVPMGVEAELRLPLNTPFPFYLGGALYYAPSVLCFKDADSYMETRIHLDAEPITNGRLEVGYRTIDTDVKDQSVTYNDSWYFGMRLDF
ncbi:YfaZ family outer membrane protein [Sulfuricurvum sp.]|uniref:YfaZ family outer membrane protein n=1 Tax=Sulfuricurvum sp. TaxID=2025608 RepID=UPI0026046535|nr:YfaZ family outer membrane protein [Sulfuricurvum sp.]MDD4883483.1 YfaZ family outer membrane protein [Sulfuricurvum sp.]